MEENSEQTSISNYKYEYVNLGENFELSGTARSLLWCEKCGQIKHTSQVYAKDMDEQVFSPENIDKLQRIADTALAAVFGGG